MLVCSIIINVKFIKSSQNIKNCNQVQRHKNRQKRQLFFILITTNSLFILLVLPVVFLNATNNIVEDTVATTVAYLLSYSNHG